MNKYKKNQSLNLPIKNFLGLYMLVTAYPSEKLFLWFCIPQIRKVSIVIVTVDVCVTLREKIPQSYALSCLGVSVAM